MIQQQINSNFKRFSLYITIKCPGKHQFRCIANEAGKVNSKYADRVIQVDGERTIFFAFPISPEKLILSIAKQNDRNDKDFKVTVTPKVLKEYAVWFDEDTRGFLELAKNFCATSGYESATPMGRPFQTADGKFTIKYYPVIRDFQSGRAMTTPARIGHATGTIEVGKFRVDPYTIPMRMIILLHEFSHKYKNPKMNLPISDEEGADVNALYIYLGLGFSKVDAIYVFANVFLKAQTPGNIKRLRVIVDYIKRFEANEFAQTA